MLRFRLIQRGLSPSHVSYLENSKMCGGCSFRCALCVRSEPLHNLRFRILNSLKYICRALFNYQNCAQKRCDCVKK